LCEEADQINSSAAKQLDETWRTLHYPPETATIWLLVRLIALIKQAVSSFLYFSLPYVECGDNK